MTRRLTWRTAVIGDRTALPAFICAEPAPRSRFGRSAPIPNKPELEAQGYIRSLQPPAPPHQLMLIGEDSLGIAAVLWAEFIGGPQDVFVKTMAVALRLRGKGYARECIDELIDRVASRADAEGLTRLRLSGNVHVDNDASRRFCDAMKAGVFQGHGELDEWVLPVDIEDEEDDVQPEG